MTATSQGISHQIALGPTNGPRRALQLDGTRREVVALSAPDATMHLAVDGHAYTFRDLLRVPRAASEGAGGDELRAPMNGRVVRIAGKAGDTVVKGQCIVVLEAMKMQHEITAARAGTIGAIAVSEGQQVATRALLASLL